MSSIDTPNNNAQVLASLTHLSQVLTNLDDRTSNRPPNDMEIGNSSLDEITRNAASLTLSSPPPIPLSHYRTLPPPVSQAYSLLSAACDHIHATSTKYTLVSKMDLTTQGGSLAVELHGGAQVLVTAALSLFSPEAGCGPSARRHIRRFSRGVVASLVSLVGSFEDGSALEGEAGAIRTGAVWAACDAVGRLPRGNRSAMRRDLMGWMRDCLESVEEFEAIVGLGFRGEDCGCEGGDEDQHDDDDDDDDDDLEEDFYSENEVKIARASINVMKCTKNVLGLVMNACECIGECVEHSSASQMDSALQSTETEAIVDSTKLGRKLEMLQWISLLMNHARIIGEGVTDFGVLLYPPIDTASNIGQLLKRHLQSLENCVNLIDDVSLSAARDDGLSCMSEEVMEMTSKLKKGIGARTAEVESALS